MRHSRAPTTVQRESGVVLLVILLFVLLTTLAAGGMVQIYQTQTQREKEEQLLFVGHQYQRAIAAYYNTFPGGRAHSLPTSLDALMQDTRFATPVQHLRQLYPDPMTGKADWVLVMQGGGIVGVHSASTQAPIKVSGFVERDKTLESKASYADWVFVVKPPQDTGRFSHDRPVVQGGSRG